MDIKYPRLSVQTQHIPMSGADKYTVKQGDTIAQIARRFDISPDDLLKFNNLKNRHQVLAGQELSIPPQSKSMTLEKAISISGGSPYSAASRVSQSWENFTGRNYEKEISKIKEQIGFSQDISVSYTKRTFFPLKLCHILSFNPLGKSNPKPFLSALSIFHKESKNLLLNAQPKTGTTASNNVSQRTIQTIGNAIKFASKIDFSKSDLNTSNKVSDLYSKNGFKELLSDENLLKISKAIIDILNMEGIKIPVLSEPNKHGMNQMDVFLASIGTIMGW